MRRTDQLTLKTFRSCFQGNGFYYHVLDRLLADCQTVADIGSGPQSVVAHRLSTRREVICLDAFHPGDSGRGVKSLADRLPCRDRSVDAAVLLDVLEHGTKEWGDRVLGEMRRIARKMVLVVTPHGLVPQGVVEGNPWQVHVCGYTPSELASRGFRIFGWNGPRFCRGQYALPRFPEFFNLWFARLSQPWLFRFPSFSYSLIAIQNVDAGEGRAAARAG